MKQTPARSRVIEALNNRENLADLFIDLFKNSNKCRDLIDDGLSQLATCFVLARDCGAVVSQPNHEMDDFLKFSLDRICFELTKSMRVDSFLAGRQIAALMYAVTCARNNGSTWVSSQEPKPLIVQVVSMPSRVTTSEIERDPKTNLIVSTIQRETDVV